MLRAEVLEKILKRESKDVDVAVTSEGVRHVIGGISITKEEVNYLKEKGVLKVEKSMSLVSCPRCANHLVVVVLTCPSCSSNNVYSLSVFTHVKCGYTSDRSKFVKDGSLHCPVCNVQIGDGELLPRGTIFECRDCSAKFETPSFTFWCTNCGLKFSIGQSSVETVSKYSISADAISSLESETITDIVYKQILKRCPDAVILRDYKVDGLSGRKYVLPSIIACDDVLKLYVHAVTRPDDIATLVPALLDVSDDIKMLVVHKPEFRATCRALNITGRAILLELRGYDKLASDLESLIAQGRISLEPKRGEGGSQERKGSQRS